MVAASFDITRETPIRVSAVPARLGVCRKTVDNWINRGLEAVHLGGTVFTTLEAINRFAIPIEHQQAEPRQNKSAVENQLQAYRNLKN